MNNQNQNNKELSVAHFSWEYPPKIWGGLGTFATELTKQQKHMGNDVKVFAVNDKNSLNPFDDWNGILVYRPKLIDITDG
ncbi:MAG: glycogen/starch synthase, partial [Candidatus Thermoplasmatota archaeon]|nr:glycogen/starch synthase [Candidatus Thermoplasmatota archaeon]